MNSEEISSISIKDNLINEIFERCKDNINNKAISREEALYLLEYDDIMPLLMNLSTFLKKLQLWHSWY